MKRNISAKVKAIAVLLVLAVLIGLYVSADDITVWHSKNQTAEKINAVCTDFGLKNINIDIRESNEDYYGCFIATISADSTIKDTDSKYFELFDSVRDVCEEYNSEMDAKRYFPRRFKAEFVLNSNTYEDSQGVLLKNGKAVQYETVEIMLRETYHDKMPYVGMPESAVDYAAYGYSYTEYSTGKRYWRDGECKYYFEISEDKKEFDGFNDYYVTSIEPVYIEPTTTEATTVKRYTKPKTTTEPDDDPYDAKDYYHAEDFYYDHYDDFFDYYEAEDYFNEHSD